MGVIGHWRRSVLGAGGVALLLPLGLAIGLALTTALGGRDGLHALAQIFSGPTAPGESGGPRAPGLEDARLVPPIPVSRPARHRLQAVSASASASGPTHTTPKTGGSGGATTAPVHLPTSGGGGTPATPSPAPAPAPPAPAPTAPPQHSALHNTGQQVADTTKSLPAPVGPVAGDAVQTVVDLIP